MPTEECRSRGTGTRLAAAALVLAAALSPVGSASASASAGWQREAPQAKLDRAIALFNVPDTHASSIGVFSELIDDITARGARRTDHEARILAQSLAYRAEARLNLGQTADAEADLAALAKLAPTFDMAPGAFSTPLRDMWGRIRPKPRGWLQISVVPRDARVEVDSRPVNHTSAIEVEPGTRTVFARREGYVEQNVTVPVAPGATVPVQLTLERLPRPPFLPRRLIISVNQSYHVNREPTSSSFPFSVYRENSEANTAYVMTEGFKTLDVSAGVRLWGALGVGIGFSRLDTSSIGTLDARVPHPTVFNAHRPMSGTVEGLRREERILHLEIRATGGNRRFEAAGFAGPSRFDVRQTVVNNFFFQDFVSRVAFVRAETLEARTDSALGFHVGGDVAVMIVPYVGFGGFVRYSHANTEFDAGRSRVTVTAGGVQGGGGLRVRF